ncbi:hypothetical protein Pla110_34340 [Polystyrenella longa]|uniref:Uncharacterized protein n=1 Tax=Polystyrenella longa TaxID=2528007 RepID=A0A518CR50_9PLAN|nr:hypothetical protein Pla110_34340 [Polystyrenella longa]
MDWMPFPACKFPLFIKTPESPEKENDSRQAFLRLTVYHPDQFRNWNTAGKYPALL